MSEPKAFTGKFPHNDWSILEIDTLKKYLAGPWSWVAVRSDPILFRRTRAGIEAKLREWGQERAA